MKKYKPLNQSSDLGNPKNEHSARARRRKMKRYLDKHFPVKKKDDE